MSTFDQLNPEYADPLKREFARLFDITPNPKGAAPTREALDERSPEPAEGREP